MVPCKRVSDQENAGLQTNDDLWQLKERAIKLLDTCADQVDARIKRGKGQ